MITNACPIAPATPDDQWHYWFGYYDKNPLSPDGTKLLAHRAAFCERFPSPEDIAEVGFITEWNTDQPTFHRLGETAAWNWQQGAMLRWHAHCADASAVAFNDLQDGQPIMRVVNLDGNEIDRINTATYAFNAQCQAATLSFGRLSRLRREYGYSALTDPNPNDPSPANDGIYRVVDDTRTLIVSIDDLDRATVGNAPRAGGDLHQHVNHIMFNPSGTRFCFMHRFDRADGILQSRLFTSDLEGKDVRLLFEGMCSHFDWVDDSNILAWGGKRSLLGDGNAPKSPKQRLMTLARRALKPIYYAMGKPRILMNKIMKDSYLLITDVDVRDDSASPPQAFAKGELTCDGHCTYNRGGKDPGRWVVTDGYPDLKSRQPLFLWDTRNDQGIEIGRWHTPRELDGELRVDLHPRFNDDATLVCIDSAMEGRRRMYVVDVRDITTG
ncbi:MAG: hypothetical protein QGH33_18550 [Pirellulaceae bacterium]|jgi:hypothetical protein|nr:hypothetical protein [Pirellulaceae bacterium]